MNLRFILIFSLFGSVTMVILVDPIPYVDAMKSEGTPTLKHGSATKGIVCGDKLCSEIKASERKFQTSYLIQNDSDFLMPKIPEFFKKFIPLPSFNENVRTSEDFYKWRETVLNQASFNFEEPPKPVTEIEKKDLGNYTVKKYSMEAYDGDLILFLRTFTKTHSR